MGFFETDGFIILQAVESIVIAMEPTRGVPPSQYRIAGEDRRRFQQSLQNIVDLIRNAGRNPDSGVVEEIQKAYDRRDLHRVAEYLERLLRPPDTSQLTIDVQAVWQPGIQRLLEFRAGLSNDGMSHIT